MTERKMATAEQVESELRDGELVLRVLLVDGRIAVHIPNPVNEEEYDALLDAAICALISAANVQTKHPESCGHLACELDNMMRALADRVREEIVDQPPALH